MHQPGYGAPKVVSEGPFAGWSTWGDGQDPYETHVGPFYLRENETGAMRCAFAPRPHHLNGAGALHGGLLMSFADFALFGLAHKALDGTMAVTLTFSSEFIDAGDLDGWVEAEGAVLRAARSVIFVQGRLVQRARPLLAFSGTIKKLRA